MFFPKLCNWTSAARDVNAIRLPPSPSVHELVRRTGFRTRSIRYLIGASLVGAIAGLLLPTGSLPAFDPLVYAQGGITITGTALLHPGAQALGQQTPILFRLLGWLSVASWADLLGRRRVVVYSLRVTWALALLIGFLPNDVAMFAVGALFQLLMPGWEVNAILMQSETAQPLNVIIPLSIIGLISTVFAMGLWFTAWACVLRMFATAPNLVVTLSQIGAAEKLDDLHTRITFMISGAILLVGFVFFRYIAKESPQYLVLGAHHEEAWQALSQFCDKENIRYALRGREPAECPLHIEATDIATHYLREPNLRKRMWLHWIELSEFLQREQNHCGLGVRCSRPRQWERKYSFSSPELLSRLSAPLTPRREETPPVPMDIGDLTLPSGGLASDLLEAAKTPTAFAKRFLLQIVSTGQVETEQYPENYPNETVEEPVDDHICDTDVRRAPKSFILMCSVVFFVVLSVNTWAGNFWYSSLPADSTVQDRRRLYVDAAGIPACFLSVALAAFFPRSIFRQLQCCVCIMIAITSLAYLALLLYDAQLTPGFRLCIIFALVSGVACADASAKAILIDHVPISLRASTTALCQVTALLLYILVHNSCRPALQPATWLASYLIATFASPKNLLWPPFWRSR